MTRDRVVRSSTQVRYPIKVAYLIELVGAGGAARQLLELASHLDRASFEPRILVWTANDFFEQDIDLADVPLHRHVRQSRLDFAVVRQAAQWLRSGEVQIVHGFLDTGNLYAVLARKLARRGVAVASQRTSERALGTLQRYHKPWAHRQAALTIANNERGRQFVMKLAGLPPERVAFIPNGIDLQRFRPVSAEQRRVLRHRWGWPDERLVLLSVGTLSPVKNYVGLAEALAALGAQHRWCGWWIGNQQTEHAADVRARLKHLGLEQQVALHRPMSRIEQAYQAADVLVLTSTREGTSNVLLEAMACGRPVLVTDVGDAGRYVRTGDNGWLLPPGRPEAWPEILEQVLHTPAEVRARMGQAARNTMLDLHMDVATMAERHGTLYEKLLAQTR